MKPNTPYYLIDERKLLKNLKKIQYVRNVSGAKFVLALKCFSTWPVFRFMRAYMDGTTSSSLYEARLGSEKFGGETHAYCVAFSENDIKQVKKYSDKVIFNSVSQLKRFCKHTRGIKTGLRVNPGISYSHFDLADPARKYSRLGVTDKNELLSALPMISGAMFHFNCENSDFGNLSQTLDFIGAKYAEVLKNLEWVSIGGGIHFTKEGYPIERFCAKLKEFSKKHGVQLYLEPGEAVITQSAELVTTVLDIVRNVNEIAIVDASMEAHMLDHLIYRTSPKIHGADAGKFTYMVAGRSCLAGDVFGTYSFKSRLKTGSILRILDAAGYAMVKKNWFNGLQMPSIIIKKLDGRLITARRFEYKDFTGSFS